jgi:hypothetical protein
MPIVDNTRLSRYYTQVLGLPMLLVNDWSELPKLLATVEMPKKSWTLDPCYVEFWVKHMQQEFKKICA